MTGAFLLAALAAAVAPAPLEERSASLLQERQQESALFRTLGLGTWGTAGSDIASTALALSRPGVREGNPLWAGRPFAVAAGAHVVGAWAVNATTARLYPSRPKTAVALRVAAVAAWGYATARNLRLYAAAP